MDRTSIASRAARWAANHRRAAILGWIAFVVAAFMIGGAVGTQTIADEDLGNGDSRTADQIVADAGYPEDDGESVLVQSTRRLDHRRRRSSRPRSATRSSGWRRSRTSPRSSRR